MEHNKTKWNTITFRVQVSGPWEFEFPFPGSLTSTFLGVGVGRETVINWFRVSGVERGTQQDNVEHNKVSGSGLRATVIDWSRNVREVVRDVACAPDPVFRVWGSVFRVWGLGSKVWC